MANKQAEIMEAEVKTEVNKVYKPGKYSNKYEDHQVQGPSKPSQGMKCFSCNGAWPHQKGKQSCPAVGHVCSICNKQNHLEQVCRAKNKKQSQKIKYVAVHNTSDESEDDSYVYNIKTIECSETYTEQTSCEVESVENNNAGVRKSQETNSENVTQSKSVDNEKKVLVHVNKVVQKSTDDTLCVIRIKNNPVKFQIDSGAAVNIISEAEFKKFKTVTLKKTKVKLYPYGTDTALNVIGCFETEVESKKKFEMATFFVVSCKSRKIDNLLGKETATNLGLLHLINAVESRSDADELIEEYKHIFQGIGKVKDVQAKLHIDKSVEGVIQNRRRIPLHLRKKVENEVNRLLEAEVIEKVEEPCDWISPVVIVPKRGTSEIRLCVDMVKPNKAIQRVRHVIPTVEELKFDLNGSKYFTKLDLNKGYHQLELEEECRYITTFSTHLGLFRFCRLNFGTNSAAEIFHEEIRKLLQGIPAAVNIYDDILIASKNKEEHKRTVRRVLDILKENNVTLNLRKCEFFKTSVKFFGHIFSDKGILPDPDKVEALEKAMPPNNKSELKSFLGMVNFSNIFIENYSTITAPLRKLLADRVNWEWNKEQDNAFNLLKSKLVNDCVLNYFDKEANTSVVCDASPFGLSAVLTQTDENNENRRVIAYASRALTKPEMNYGHIEKEALAILFGCTKFRLYLLGKPFVVYTDHQPLKTMFNNPKAQSPFKVDRIRLKLQGFDFKVDYIKGSKNPSDFISRCFTTSKKEDEMFAKDLESHVHLVTKGDIFDMVSNDVIRNETLVDDECLKLKECIRQGKLDEQLKSYKHIFDELSFADGLILKGNRIFIPRKFRKEVIKVAHEGHQGIVKTKALVRSRIWYPGVDKDVEDVVKSCFACQATTLHNEREPLKMSELPAAPWEKVSVDYHGPLASGEYLLVVIDDYSRFPFVEISKSTSAKATIPKLDKIFSAVGIPSSLKSDNGSPFNSDEFKRFVTHMGITTHHITPRYPQANGLVENFNILLDKVLSTAFVEHKNWKQEMYTFLRNYRATPHSTTGEAPANLLFQKRCFRTRLPEVTIIPDDINVREEDKRRKMITKKYADSKSYVKDCLLKEGDVVLVKIKRARKGTPHYDTKPYIIIKRKGNMITAKRNDKEIVRNSSFFKKLIKSDESDDVLSSQENKDDLDLNIDENNDNVPEHNQEEEQGAEENPMPAPRKSQRQRQIPTHLSRDYELKF